MKHPMIALAMYAALAGTAAAADVTVTVSNVKPGGGGIAGGLQTEAQFLKAEASYGARSPGDQSTATLVFRNVAPGDYAVAVAQDSQGDGKITMGARGPVGAWGVSGYTGGRPDWAQSRVTVGSLDTTAAVALRQPD